MNTKILYDMAKQLTEQPTLLPPISVKFSYVQEDISSFFRYEHPEEVYSKAEFQVSFSSISDLRECKTENGTTYLTGFAQAQKPIIVNIFFDVIQAICETPNVLMPYAEENKTSSLIVASDGRGFNLQWVYNQFKQDFIAKNKKNYTDRAAVNYTNLKSAFVSDQTTMKKINSFKINQLSMLQSKKVKYICLDCKLLSREWVCTNCGSKSVDTLRNDLTEQDILQNIPTAIHRGLLNLNKMV